MTYFEVLEAVKVMAESGTFNYAEYIRLVDMNLWTSLMFWFCCGAVWSMVLLPMAYGIKYIIMIVKDTKDEIENGEFNSDL